jgi:hypothetical protein
VQGLFVHKLWTAEHECRSKLGWIGGDRLLRLDREVITERIRQLRWIKRLGQNWRWG